MHVVGAGPALVNRRVGTDHVVVGEQVGVAELLDALGVCAHRADVATEFRLGEHHADAHTGHAISVHDS